MDENDSDQILDVGEIGELAVKGPQVMLGYWKKPEETQKVFRDGWLYTGDMARMDEEGFFYIVDRKKDMIKTKGENVYPRDVEEVLFKYSKIQDAVVVGIPDHFAGEIIKAYIVLKENESSTVEEIRAFCKENMAAFKVPKDIEFRSELPNTIIGNY